MEACESWFGVHRGWGSVKAQVSGFDVCCGWTHFRRETADVPGEIFDTHVIKHSRYNLVVLARYLTEKQTHICGKKKKEDALQFIIFCKQHIAFITQCITFISHLHVLIKHRVRLRTRGAICCCQGGGGRTVWNWMLFGDVDGRSEKTESTYIGSSRVHRSSSRVRDVVVWRNTASIACIRDRQERLVLRNRETTRVMGRPEVTGRCGGRGHSGGRWQ